MTGTRGEENILQRNPKGKIKEEGLDPGRGTPLAAQVVPWPVDTFVIRVVPWQGDTCSMFGGHPF